MKKDIWITVEDAIKRLLEKGYKNPVIKGNMLSAVNHNKASISLRIFDGTEHNLAKAGMILEW